MNEKAAINNSAYCQSINLLNWLLKMNIIEKDEFIKISHISAEYYGVNIYCV